MRQRGTRDGRLSTAKTPRHTYNRPPVMHNKQPVMSSKGFITSGSTHRFFFLSSPRVRGPHSYPTQATAKPLPLPHTLTLVARRAADHTVSPHNHARPRSEPFPLPACHHSPSFIVLCCLALCWFTCPRGSSVPQTCRPGSYTHTQHNQHTSD